MTLRRARWSHGPALGVSLVAAFVAVTLPARAASEDAAAAEALFRRARDAIRLNDYATACPLFAESQRLDPSVGTLMNLAACDEQLGELAEAWERWHEAIEQLQRAGDSRLQTARDRADALEKRLPRLTVRVNGAAQAMQVTRDEVELGPPSWGLALPVDPGRHRVVLAVAGRAVDEKTVDVAEGGSVVVMLSPASRASEASSATQHSGGPALSPPSTRHLPPSVAFGALAISGAALVTAIVSGVVILHDHAVTGAQCAADGGCSPSGLAAAHTGRTWLTVNTASWIAAGAMGGFGVTVLLLDHGSGTGTPAALQSRAVILSATF